jgi:shikimate kinase
MAEPLPLAPLTSTRIFLVGGRGAGKTTVGRLLAARLNWQFADLDDDVIRVAKQSIASMFGSGNEAEFRRLEVELLSHLASLPRAVITTGGGAVLSQSSREVLASQGFVVWLRADPEVMYQRISVDPSTAQRRPNLTSVGGLEEMILVLREREPLYMEVADLIVDTTHLSPDGVVSAILAAC